MPNLPHLAIAGLAAALSLAGCVSGTSLVLTEDGGVHVKGISRDSPLYKAMLEVYEECGGTPDRKMTNINWRADPVLPVWTEEKGWHFKNFECISPEQSATLKFSP